MARIVELTGLDIPELDVFARLTEAQLRRRLEPEKGLFIAESPKVIALALEAGCEPVSFLTEKRYLQGQLDGILARCADGVPVYTGPRELLASLTGYALTRGVLCAMRRPAPRRFEAVCAGARRIAVLENIADAANVGALFRSAAALGVDAVLLSPGCCDALNRRAVRVSMGSVFLAPWAVLEEGWPDPCLERLRALGFRSAAMALRPDALPIDDPRLAAEERLAIVLGAEGDGLAADTVAKCDYTARIPMSHGVDSLNVAAAGALAFWELRAGKTGGFLKNI